MHLIVYVDGGARPNPGAGGCGVWVLRDGNGGEGWGTWLGPACTNNVAEYTAMTQALSHLEDLIKTTKATFGGNMHESAAWTMACKPVIYTDSQLVCRQLTGEYAVANATLQQMHAECQELLRQIAVTHGVTVRIEHVPRSANGMADALAGAAIEHRRDVTAVDDLDAQSMKRIYRQRVGPRSKKRKAI